MKKDTIVIHFKTSGLKEVVAAAKAAYMAIKAAEKAWDKFQKKTTKKQ